MTPDELTGVTTSRAGDIRRDNEEDLRFEGAVGRDWNM